MVAGGDTHSSVPSYLNPDNLVEGALDGVAQHREHTRQVLSNGCDDIASSYFANQYGTTPQANGKASNSKTGSKTNSRTTSRTNSRRNSFSQKGNCTNNLVQSTMASAAAKIAKLKQQEREEHRNKYKDQSQQETQNQQMASQQTVNQQIVNQQTVNQQTVNEQMINQQTVNQQTASQQIVNQQMVNQQTLNHQTMNQQMTNQQQMSFQQHEQQQEAETGKSGSRRGSQQFSYLTLLPEDGSFPHRTQPIGEPQTKKSNSTAPTPDRELVRKKSFHGSTDFLHATSNTNYAARSNPIGLAEPSQGRDGYGVGKDGSLYRSTGNLNVAGGHSRAGSVSRETNNSWKGERRGSHAEVKGCGIRTGGNLIEPSSKPPPSCFNMPFGSAVKSSGGYKKSSARSHKTTTKRERNKSLSGDSRSIAELTQTTKEHTTMNVTIARPKVRAQSMPRGKVSHEETSYTVSLPPSRNTSRQTSVEPETRTKLTRHGSVEIFDAGYKMVLPNKQQQGKHSSQTKLEEIQADHYFFPGKNVVEVEVSEPKVKPNVQCIGVEVYHKEEKKANEVEATNKDVKQELSNLTSSNKQEEVSQVSHTVKSQSAYSEQSSYQESSVTSNQTTMQSSSSLQQSTESKSYQSTQQSVQSSQQSVQSSQQSVQSSQQNVQSSQHSVQSSQQSVQSSQQSVQSSQQSVQSSQQSVLSNKQNKQITNVTNNSRSRHTSGNNATVVQSNKFNIENALKRNSRTCSSENVKKSSQTTTATSTESGSMLKQLDVALQQYAQQQDKQQQNQQGEQMYVAKCHSRTTSRRGSVSVNGEEEVTNITVSLPSSRNQSRTHSRRNSVDLGKKSSRRNSLDIYTAEYAIKLAAQKSAEAKNSSNQNNNTNKNQKQQYKIDTMEQKSAFHFKVANEAESGLDLCGRCHLPTHRVNDCTEYADSLCPACLSWEHWIDACPVQENQYICTRCNYIGHTEEVHQVTKYKQRRCCVDLLGWEPFQDWFFEQDFRNWWQVTGCVGVPLYRLYPRKTEWRKERKPEPVKKAGGNKLTKGDSVDDMIAQVLKQRKTVKPANSGDDSSGRSSPDIGTNNGDGSPATEQTANGETVPRRKPRTFSATLRSLDQDILAELDL